jgi:hypothetical protein
MIKRTFRTILFLSIISLTIDSCKKDDDDTPAPTIPSTNPARDAALADYNSNYLGSEVISLGWTGNASTCTAGTLPQSTHDAVIKRINYFRKLVGLNSNCTLDASLFGQEQEAALMMTANNQLNHAPPSTWTCYTSAGYAGAASSNLALGYHSSDAITVFINDFGTGNERVGHRRWILHSRKQKFSYGCTSNATALYVFNADTNTQVPDFIAYPPGAYIPQTLVFGRWSFGIPNANFSAATVTMTGTSGNVPLSVVSNNAVGYGDNTIVWAPTGIDLTNDADVSYHVVVSGITGAAQASYAYDVKIFKP